ncbi:right-handed parallel beta-helix repeat-containing protein [candidate division KSB1 bacterium]|nr:right-handed parallel beta-helix repeat-containing protein [candidate division KSB1 bacterium]
MKKFFVLFNVLCFGLIVHANVIHVPGQKTTIADAIQMASDGDTVLVARGTYTQAALLNINKPVTVASHYIYSQNEEDIDNTIIEPMSEEMEEWIELSAQNSRIIGFKLMGSDFHTLNITSSYAEVMCCKFIGGKDQLSMSRGGGYVGYCYFENGGDDGIDCDNSVNWIIEHNTIVNAYQDGIEIRLQDKEAPLTTHIFRYNKIIGSGESGIQIIDYQGNSYREFYVHHNIFQDCRGSGFSCMYQEIDNTSEVYKGSLMQEKAYVYNNTFIGCNYGLTLSPGLTVLNNIFVHLKTMGIERGEYVNDDNDLSFIDFCLFYDNPVHYDPDIRIGTNIIMDKDPLLDEDQNLLSGSPAIDAGTEQFAKQGMTLEIPASDYAGIHPDFGAKEFGKDNWDTGRLAVVNAGEDQIIIAPKNEVILKATITGIIPNGESSINLQWSKVSGPGEVKFSNASGLVTTAVFSMQGIYKLMLTMDNGKNKTSDKITVSYVTDFVDRSVNVGAGKDVFIEAEDYRYLIGTVEVISMPGASGKVVRTQNGQNKRACAEYRISTQSAGTYYIWINGGGNKKAKVNLYVAFNKSANEQQIIGAQDVDFGTESWRRAVFHETPEGIYTLRIRAEEEGVMWDRIFITSDAAQQPWE